MMTKVYAVKADFCSDPHIAFSELIEACDYAINLHPDMETKKLADLIVSIPVFESFDLFDGEVCDGS